MVGNHLWNSIRVKNFVKGLNKKPTKWDENIAFLADKAGITVEKFLLTDPISYGVMIWGYDRKYPGTPSSIIQKVMGSVYNQCQWYYSSACEAKRRIIEGASYMTYAERDKAIYDAKVAGNPPPACTSDILAADAASPQNAAWRATTRRATADFLSPNIHPADTITIADVEVRAVDNSRVIQAVSIAADAISNATNAISTATAAFSIATNAFSIASESIVPDGSAANGDEMDYYVTDWCCSECTAVWVTEPIPKKLDFPVYYSHNEWHCPGCTAVWRTV